METPSSTRRVTRSQTLAAASNNNIPISKRTEESARKRSGNKSQERSALIDITNDSPIVGLAMGSLETPLSSMAKQKRNEGIKMMMTPGSGEALLRGQVKTLLQKVEEEAELSKLSLEARPFLHVQGLITSPMLLAPTPANTPQVDQSTDNAVLPSIMPSPMGQQVVNHIFEGEKQESIESEISPISRSLLLDFSEPSESKDKTGQEEDDASVWSIQVNASIKDDEEEEKEEEDDYQEVLDYEEEEEEENEAVDELCEGMSKISVNENRKVTGKHTRFVYNSDDELVQEERVLHFKGLPTPKGKHLRFPMDEEEENN